MDLIRTIAKKLNISHGKVENTVDLLKNDNTIPFIARYRKELTGNLDEVQIQDINDALKHLENLEKRRQSILNTIQSSGKLTDALERKILQAESITILEDLYQPYKIKKQTRATIARENGLEPLANVIISQPVDDNVIADYVKPYLNDKVPNQDAAITSASDIIAEMVNENAAVRQLLREKLTKSGEIIVEKHADAQDERAVYQDYYQFRQQLNNIRHYQVLAVNRGEKEKVLKVSIQIEEEIWKDIVFSQYPPKKHSIFYEVLVTAVEDGVKRLLLPSIIRDIRRDIKQRAETHAIKVFANNLRPLLTQPPISGHTVIGIDPGYRTGCKVVVVDPNGKLLDKATMYPHPPQNNLEQAYSTLIMLISQYHVTLIVIGNGTASRETEKLIAEITKNNEELSYMITSEAGASVYSASEVARNEFPDLDVSMRGAVSIARRVQDPLAELVKIDPRSIGVGMYQHDLNQSKLSEALDQVIESVVNSVGVEINTASSELLAHVAAIGQSLARKIIEYREENGSFSNRYELLEVPGVGPKTFEQAAGFLRIRNSNNPLDATAIHPESYPLAYKIMHKFDMPNNISSEEKAKKINQIKNTVDLQNLANELKTGFPTLIDVINEFVHPGRDPREALPKPILRNDVLSMEDLSSGMQLKGTIRNVVDFGAFVDIGVKIDGLLHRSKIPNNSKLKVGDVIDLKIVSIDNDRNRIALSMKEILDK